jgi:leucyl aminopeptidase (aminopeptidase T)
MTVLRWGEWGEAVVQMLVEVKPGEELLILTDTGTNKEIGEACLIAGINAKANAQLLVIPQMSRKDYARDFRSAAGAIQGADVIVDLCDMSSESLSAAMLKAREKGARVTSCAVRGVEDYVIAAVLDVDYPLMVEMAEKMCGLWRKTEICRVTSVLGTDISFRLKGRPALRGDGRATEPGVHEYFPGASPSIAPVEETINGTIVVDGTIVVHGISAPIGRVSAPVTLRLEKGVITAIEGGADADALRSHLGSTGDPKALYLCHFKVRMNPAARMGVKLRQDEMVMGAATFGFGSQDPTFEGTVGLAKMHTDVVLVSPIIYLDGVVMCENNKFNPDLGLGGL